NHQSGSRTVVCDASQEPQGRSFRREPRRLCVATEGSCSCDRRSCFAGSIEIKGENRCRTLSISQKSPRPEAATGRSAAMTAYSNAIKGNVDVQIAVSVR